MFLNSRGVALLLAIAISAVTLAFTSLVSEATSTILFVVTIISFGAAYILSQITLDYLIFRELNKLYDRLNRLREKDYQLPNTPFAKGIGPMRRINEEITNYAQFKEKEIMELKRAEAFRREFLADISHELKTPIFAAQGFVYTLLDGAIKDKAVRKRFLKKAAKSLDGLHILVQELLTISQMEIGEIQMHPEHFNVYEVVHDIYDQFEAKSERRGVRLTFHKDINPRTYVFADPQRIYQVISNLVSNGIKYSEEGGIVEVAFRTTDEGIVILVRDEGPGIAEEHVPRIFERFYRVDKSRSKDRGGTGLGLAIVKHILEAHNSSITVDSLMGKGTTFSFMLPAGEVPEGDDDFFLEQDLEDPEEEDDRAFEEDED